MHLTRRTATLGLLGLLPGCGAIGALSGTTPALPTFEPAPVPGAQGQRRAITLLVAEPAAPAAIATDRILVKFDPLSVAYLPDARWSEEVPTLLQSLVIRSIAATGRLAHVGDVEGGPVPDVALLLRIDAFQAEPEPERTQIPVRVAFAATLIRDRDQRLLAARDFAGGAEAPSERPGAIVPAFQAAIGALLPVLADWTAANASG